MHPTTLLALALSPLLALAKTDLSGCTSTASGGVLTWYVPGTGELCSILDCGGGRAPPKTTVPGCAAYSGTAAYQPSYLAGWGPNGQTSTPAATTTAPGSKPTETGSGAGGVVSTSAAATLPSDRPGVSWGPSSYGTLTPSGANGTLAVATGKATPSTFSGPSGGAGAVGLDGVLGVVAAAVAVAGAAVLM